MNEPTLAFACPVCGNPMLIPDSLRGRELQCPHENCGAIFQTPSLDEPVVHEDTEANTPAPDARADGAKARRKQLPKGPGLKRKGPAAGPRPTRTAPAKPSGTGGDSTAPEPPKPPPPAVKTSMSNGTKLSYLLGVVIVIGAIIYNKTSKHTPNPGGAAPPAAQASATSPARASSGGATNAPRPSTPVHVTPPAGKKKGKEMTEEERNRFNESLSKADAEKRTEERTAFEKRLARAGEGSKTAQYDVGMMYLKGTGTEPDRAKAREWLDKSAAQNHPPAFNGLGDLEALEGDREKAVAHFAKAGGLSAAGYLEDDEKAKKVVYHALEQLDVLGARKEHAELAAKTTKKDEPKEEPAKVAPAPETPVSPDAPAPGAPPAPEPPVVLDLPPLPDPPPAVEIPPEPVTPPPGAPPAPEPPVVIDLPPLPDPPPAPDAPAPPGEIKEP